MTYFDNAATTYPIYRRSQFGIKGSWLNSNTSYAKDAKNSLINSSNAIKKCLHVNDGIVLYFRCATEAIEWLSKFVPDRFSCLSCETTAHDSVYKLATVVQENPNKPGIWVESLVNPVTGNIISANEEIIQAPTKHLYIGCDYTAAVGHIPLPEKHDYDFIYFSGHKFGTEKGIGAMWIGKELAEYLNVITDSNNQYDLVHGTVDVEGAAMLAFAMQIACTEQKIKIQNDRYEKFITTIINNLKEKGIECKIIGKSENFNDGVKGENYAINAIFTPFNADALATYLASKGIYVGVGHSACSGSADYRVLENMGYGDVADKVIRISFGPHNNMLDVQNFCEEVIKFKELF